MSSKDQIIAWLSDVHAVEENLSAVLAAHCKEAEPFPEVRERLERHLHETRRHAQRVVELLRSLGSAPSAVKTAAGRTMGMVEGISTGLFRDSLVKNAIADYAMEHFEMACYSALAASADDAGLPNVAQTCREIFGEEAEMADWLEEQIPEISRLHLQSAGVQ